MDNQNEQLNNILEIVNFIKGNAAAKEDLKPLATKEDLARLDNRVEGIETKMATKEDLARTNLEIVLIKEKMATKEDLEKIDEKFNSLIDSIDRLTKKVDDYFQETVSTGHALKRHEKWIQQLASKLDIKLEY